MSYRVVFNVSLKLKCKKANLVNSKTIPKIKRNTKEKSHKKRWQNCLA